MVSCWYIQSQTSRAMRILLTSIHRYSELKTGKYDDQMLFLCVLCEIKSIMRGCTWSDNKVCELIAVKVLHTSLLNTTVVAFKVLPLGSYTPMPAPSPPFKTILELVLWNGLYSCRCITPDDISSSKCLPFNISFIFRNRKKSLGARSSE